MDLFKARWTGLRQRLLWQTEDLDAEIISVGDEMSATKNVSLNNEMTNLMTIKGAIEGVFKMMHELDCQYRQEDKCYRR